jgi:hypothetical protein
LRHIRSFVIVAVTLTAAAVSVSVASAQASNRAGVVSATAGATGTYQPITPFRLLDTRIGTGATEGAVGPKGIVQLQVTGVGGVPQSDVSAVVLNVTETGATASSFVTVYPTGATKPSASSLNFTAGTTLANSVTVQLGTDGQVDLYNNSGDTQLIADVTGFFISDDSGAAADQYHLVGQSRLLDTRQTAAVGGHQEITVWVNYTPVVNSTIKALAVNITSVGSTKPGFLTAWDGTGTPPTTSTLNFAAGAIVPNMAIVPTSICALAGPCNGLPSITIYNGSTAPTNVLVDITGTFNSGTLPGGMIFHPMTPTRIVDTRIDLGASGPLAGGTFDNIKPPTSIVDASTGAVALNVTAVAPTALSFFALYPTDVIRPTGSTLNPAAKQTVANAAIVTLGDGREFSVYNSTGSANFVVDVAGTYEFATN